MLKKRDVTPNISQAPLLALSGNGKVVVTVHTVGSSGAGGGNDSLESGRESTDIVGKKGSEDPVAVALVWDATKLDGDPLRTFHFCKDEPVAIALSGKWGAACCGVPIGKG